MATTYGPTAQDDRQSIDGSLRNYSIKMLSGFVMIGEKIGIAKYYLKYRSGYPQPSGTLYATIYNSSGGVRSTSEGVDMSTTTDSYAWYEFCFTSLVEVSQDDYVSVTADYDSPPNTSNGWIDCGMSTTVPSTVEGYLGTEGSPDDAAGPFSGEQPTMELTTDTCTPVSSGGTFMPPPIAPVYI